MQPGTAPADPDQLPAAPRPRRTAWLASFAWPLVCLFQLGLIAGALRFGFSLAEPEPTVAIELLTEQFVPAPPVLKPEPLETRKPRAAKGELEDVDRLIRVGRYELALTLCRTFTDKAVADLRDAFQYRLGLCLEGLGHWDEALTAYRKLASHTPSPRIGAVASLGQARVWLRMRRPAESKALLCDLLRRSDLPGLRGQSFMTDARYLLALALPLEVLPSEPPGPFNDDPVSPLTSDWSQDRALDWWKDEAKKETNASPPSLAEIVEVERGEVVFVRIHVARMALTGLLDQLAEQAHLRIEWSAHVRQQAEGRSMIVALERAALTDALRVLTEPLGLVWTIERNKLSLTSEDESSPEEVKSRRLANARRALRDVVLAFPRHPLTPAAYLELGDLEALTGHLEEALTWYNRLTREWPRSPLAVEGQYNLGLLRCRQGDRPVARQAFYRVVDRVPAHELTPLAYWRVGRIYLEEGEAEKALSPLRRALRSGTGSPAHAAAALTMAAAHLLTDNPRAANAVLVEHRELVNHDGYRNAAAFLDTLARFRAVTDRRRRQREAVDLLAALLMVQDDALLGSSGLALMGQSYRELGMQEEMARVYQKALTGLRGPLAAELSLALAEAYWATDKHDDAMRLYRKLAAGEPSNGAKRARMRLAEIALSEKRSQECLKSCRELLQEKTAVDVPAVLRLMAGAFEQMGERDKAIRCLRGELPP